MLLTRENYLIHCNDLRAQYKELLCLRAELARLLFPLKISPPRKNRTKRRNRSAARPVKRHEQPASAAPILLLVAEVLKHCSHASETTFGPLPSFARPSPAKRRWSRPRRWRSGMGMASRRLDAAASLAPLGVCTHGSCRKMGLWQGAMTMTGETICDPPPWATAVEGF